MDSRCDQAGLRTDVVEPDLVAEAEHELIALVLARALLSALEHRGEPSRELQTSVPQKDLTKEELKILFENLGPYSNILNASGAKLLIYLYSCFQKFKWLQETIKTISSAIRFLNIIRYFYKNLVQAKHGRVLSGELHIVLVGEGSFNNQVCPAELLIPGDSITDTILYSPWNCSIDANVAYGIATGDLQLQHRHFWNNQAMEQQQPQVPDHWNSIRAQHQEFVPEIILGPITANADLITALADWINLYNRNRIIIPYAAGGNLAHWLPSVPLYQIIGAIAVLLKIIPPHKATIHLAADLEYGEAAQPNVERLNAQYVYTPAGTVMTTQNMQFTEFPRLYDVFRTIFNPAPPQ
ncbi:uncharacterized protein LOC125802540 [Astyanax mexicanus]|uniref:uncharacterized protein LOC125802540 n=1 Tax=Astyanax mexicanus TaxID=7994 RepID=UPI0020CA9E13|nr:uncharacterized protein LOC125802540 [Astyanax mexicanus]